MNIAIVTCTFKRPELNKIVHKYYTDNFENCVLISVGAFNDYQNVNYIWNNYTFQNQPLAQKFNFAFERAKTFSPYAVVLIGSADLLSKELIEYYQKNYSHDADYVLGLKDLYLYEISTRRTMWWHGFPPAYADQPIGGGRIFSRKVLDIMDWRPYGDSQLNRGLDNNSALLMKSKGIGMRTVTMDESGIAVGLKPFQTLNKFETWLYNGELIESNLMQNNFSAYLDAIHATEPDESKFKGTVTVKFLKDLEEFRDGHEMQMDGMTALGLVRNKIVELI